MQHRHTLRSWFAVATVACALAQAPSALAQATCPSASRLSFYPVNNIGVITAATLATARYQITLGSDTRLFGTRYLLASINNVDTNQCSLYLVSDDNGATALTSLRGTAANLCMGPFADFVEVVAVTGQHGPTCAGLKLDPLVTSGTRLQTYLGDGNDKIGGSAGADRIYGGSGADLIGDRGGTGDRHYGENSSDSMMGSPGPSTLTDSGSGADFIYDPVAVSSDTFYGGTNSDEITACVADIVDCGGNNGDVAYTISSTAGCQTVNVAPYCD